MLLHIAFILAPNSAHTRSERQLHVYRHMPTNIFLRCLGVFCSCIVIAAFFFLPQGHLYRPPFTPPRNVTPGLNPFSALDLCNGLFPTAYHTLLTYNMFFFSDNAK